MHMETRVNWKLVGEPEDRREEVLSELFDRGMGLRVVVVDVK